MLKNKKGFEIIGGRVINYIIAAIVILLIVYLGIRLWYISGDNKIERAQEQMEVIEAAMKSARELNIPKNFEIFPPVKWYLRTFSNYDFPTGFCNGKKDIGCLCFCDKLDCTGRNYCKGFEFDVSVNETLESYYEKLSGVNEAYLPTREKTRGVLELEEIEKLTVFKDRDIIVIKRFENAK